MSEAQRPNLRLVGQPTPVLKIELKIFPPASQETIAFAEKLLKAARTGQVRGVAAMVFMDGKAGKTAFAEINGLACSDPMSARGSLCMLDDKLRKQIDSQMVP